MKTVIISHRSALRLIRENRVSPIDMALIKDVDEYLKVTCPPVRGKIDLLTSSKNQTRPSKKFKYHVASHNIKNNMLIKFTENIYCVKPELLIVELASILNFEQLFLLICEFCGTYSFDEANYDCATNLEPLTSVERIQKFADTQLNDAKYFWGQSRLNKVLQYARNNSFSPMESKLLLKFSGPRNMGMYGIKGLDLNKPIKLSKKASLIAGQNTVVPDLSISEYKVAIEYDSAQFHEEIKQGQKDKRRRDALVKDNWVVHTIVPLIMNNPNSFHVVAKTVLEETNQNARIRNKNFTQMRNALFERLV